MAAHVRNIIASCSRVGCDKPATVEVFSTRNDAMGKYCRRDGEARAAELRRADEKAGR